jgi:hypothetical protein
VLRKGSPFLNGLYILTGPYERGTSGWTCGRTELDNLFRRKIRVVNDEKDLYFVFPLSHLSPAFWVLELGYLLIQLRFLPKHFSGRFPNFGTMACPEFEH